MPPDRDEAARLWRLAGQTSALGIELGACVMVGTGLGAWGDRHSAHAPMWTLVGFVFGIAAAGTSLRRFLAGRRGPPPQG